MNRIWPLLTVAASLACGLFCNAQLRANRTTFCARTPGKAQRGHCRCLRARVCRLSSTMRSPPRNAKRAIRSISKRYFPSSFTIAFDSRGVLRTRRDYRSQASRKGKRNRRAAHAPEHDDSSQRHTVDFNAISTERRARVAMKAPTPKEKSRRHRQRTTLDRRESTRITSTVVPRGNPSSGPRVSSMLPGQRRAGSGANSGSARRSQWRWLRCPRQFPWTSRRSNVVSLSVSP